jgi:hypothetical protein
LTALLCRTPAATAALLQVPLAMDCTEQCILIASAPLQLLVLQLEGLPAAAAAGGSASLLPAGRSSAGLAAGSGQRRLVAVRELSMFNVGRPVQDMALVSPAAADMAKRVLRGARMLRRDASGWRIALPDQLQLDQHIRICCKPLPVFMHCLACGMWQ